MPCPSESEVSRRQHLDAAELDFHFGRGVGVGAGTNDRVAACDVVAELRRPGQRGLADPAKALLARLRAVGIEVAHVEYVLAGREVLAVEPLPAFSLPLQWPPPWAARLPGSADGRAH